jgi:2-polyprenyl-6-hydroxyphenyl methylase/3-demethylubiquinone-9 3-methyltransferase
MYDIIYSWGVLHHTGEMYHAFENIAMLVKPGGKLVIAIYNKNTTHIFEGTSRMWARVKRCYNSVGKTGKSIIYSLYLGYFFLGLLVTGKNPKRYIAEFPKKRGMDFYADIRDWLGGYPYEYASVEEVTEHFKQRGFRLALVKPARSLGCNEFVFELPRRG